MNPANDHAPHKFSQGMALFRSGKLAEAYRVFAGLIRENPRNDNALSMLGVVCGSLGRLSEAETAFRQAVAVQPANFAAWDNLGTALLMRGNPGEAVTCLERALQINAKSPTTLNNLGNAYRQLGRAADAENCYRKAISLNSRYPEACNNLGNLCKDLCRLDEAERLYRKALKLNGSYVDAWFNLGSVQMGSGRHEQALQSFRKALDLNPECVPAVAAIASVHEKQRRYAESAAVLEPYIDRALVAPAIALAYAEVAPRMDKRDKAIQALRTALNQQNISPIERQEMMFALGKLYDGAGKFDEAFSWFRSANELRQSPYDPAIHRRQFDSLKAVFRQGSALPRLTGTGGGMIFVIGMPRSGTSLVEQILASHPEVFGAGELDGISKLASGMAGRFSTHNGYPECMPELAPQQLQLLAREYLHTVEKMASGKKRITDKMPHNFIHLGLVACLFPEARVVHCLRDPVDTCLSIYFHNFNANHPYASRMESLADYYRDYLALMEYWKSVLDIPIIDIQYEAMVEQQELTSRRLLEFCGLEWNEACLEFHKTDRVVKTPSYNQVNQPVYRGSVQRWKNYEKFVGPLVSALR